MEANAKTYDEIKDNIEHLTRCCQVRGMKIYDVKELYKELDLESSNSWNGIISKIQNLTDTSKFEALSNLENKLATMLNYHRLFSDKAIRAYLNHEDYDAIKVELALAHSQAKEIDGNFQTEAAQIFNSLIFYPYKTERTFTEKVSINPKSLTPLGNNDLSYESFDEIIAIKRIKKTCIDSLIIDNSSKSIFISIDLASMLRSDEIHAAAAKILSILNKHARKTEKQVRFGDSSKNLFPLIEKFYNETAGEVTEMTFSTRDGTTHYERLHSGIKDLRKSKYHLKGSQATTITPYRIGKRYPHIINGSLVNPEIELPGRYKSITTAGTPRLEDALIKNALLPSAFIFSLNKIVSFLK